MKIFLLLLSALLFSSCSMGQKEKSNNKVESNYPITDTATFAGGCFWCVEASFEQIKGVAKAVSGYAGGKASTATYKKVSGGQTKHAEAVQIYYNNEVIDYNTLLDIFFTAHDPTQLNRQGPDVGPQYRSEIFYHNEDQHLQAKNKIKKIDESGQHDSEVVTKLNPYQNFYKAEAYHQDYIRKYPDDWYVSSVSRPKVEKVRKKFKRNLKKGFENYWEEE